MKILFVIDPIKKLDWEWDNSLHLLREFSRRSYQIFICDTPDLFYSGSAVYARARQVRVCPHKSFQDPEHLKLSAAKEIKTEAFRLIVFRKEPPFDTHYLYATLLLDHAAKTVPVSNHPTGIRNLNEKLSTLPFQKWIPKSLVTTSPDIILNFQNQLKKPLVIKPLNQKGGRGVFILPLKEKRKKDLLMKATHRQNQFIMAQERLTIDGQGEKRVVLLNGKFLTAYEKKPQKNEFRANLGLGGTWHPAVLSKNETHLVGDLKPLLKSAGIHLAGIDILNEKLIEINVTCPAGISEATALYPQLELVKEWASFLENLHPQR